jgi:colanic acid biosynthesis protein WcaH
MSEWISVEEWRTIVANVPIVSVDLVVLHDGGVVLGRRTNEPAKGEWFVPGGRVRKGERLEEAVYRVAQEELGVDVTIRERLGAYEHLYETSDVEGVESKHYVANGFVVEALADPTVADGQHDDIRLFQERPAECHDYIAAYLDESKVLESKAD